MRSIRLLAAGGIAAVLAGVIAVGVVAISGDDPDTAVSATPPSRSTPGAPQPAGAISPLPAIRADLAARWGVDISTVELVRLKHAGWNGCLGVTTPGQACTEQFIGGYIALFTGPEGRTGEYHVGGDRYLGPVDRRNTQVDDGYPVPPEIQADFDSILADYARHDLALRERARATDVTLLQIVPFELDIQCFAPCDTHAASIGLELESATYGYVVNSERPIAFEGTADPRTGEHASVQLAMREDLAKRVARPLDDVSVVAYRLVTWPDGCLGAQTPGQVCSQALLPGFTATLEAGGLCYEYHGTNERFIAVSFLRDVTPSRPLPPQ